MLISCWCILFVPATMLAAWLPHRLHRKHFAIPGLILHRDSNRPVAVPAGVRRPDFRARSVGNLGAAAHPDRRRPSTRALTGDWGKSRQLARPD